MKNPLVWLIIFTLLTLDARYLWQIRQHKIDPEHHKVAPTLSTWIIFLAGTSLSLITYILAKKHDFESGILNIVDVADCFVIMVAIILFNNKEVKLRPFEKFYTESFPAMLGDLIFSPRF